MPITGPTNKYPYGKINPSDEGELQIAIAADKQNGIVQIQFGTPTAWLGLESNIARKLAEILIEKADEVDRSKQ